MYKRTLTWLFIIFAINLPGIYYGWYLRFWWFDVILHFSGGFFMAMLMSLYLRDRLLPGENLKNILIVAGATVFIGVIWEFTEFIASQTLTDFVYDKLGIRAYFMGDLRDTVADLLLDILGAITFYGLHLVRSRNSHKVEA